MGKDYTEIVVESFLPTSTAGLHGKVHIRPVAGQDPFLPSMFVECSKELSEDYEVGTKFLIKAKVTSRKGKGVFIYSSYKWRYVVLN
ncbi:hypothetical protein [Mucilaginibacter pocheonensis]|uniref:Uncharacterized protein n=1 Tax=Mucilaginibacter pocheonensis TaxID=398050 RepID=A0ABU1TC97_9SPHI|nr:hypothetical protein [Mucilaginibacter pocheonensis]MDR6943029.1 hypothetical protein [Mucilaginibacter pocheonensis]